MGFEAVTWDWVWKVESDRLQRHHWHPRDGFDGSWKFEAYRSSRFREIPISILDPCYSTFTTEIPKDFQLDLQPARSGIQNIISPWIIGFWWSQWMYREDLSPQKAVIRRSSSNLEWHQFPMEFRTFHSQIYRTQGPNSQVPRQPYNRVLMGSILPGWIIRRS